VQMSHTTTPDTPRVTDVLPTTAPSRPCCPRLRMGRWLMLVALIGLAAFFGTQWYWNHQANWGTVVPGQIFRSATVSRHLIRRKLADNRIGVIVFLSRDTGDDVDLSAERNAAREMGVKFLNFPMNGDGVASPEQYTAALAAVCQAKAEGKPVLIHCHSGAQRTGGVVAMYRLLVEGQPPSQAYAEMRHYGYNPAHNTTLLPFLNEHIAQWAQALADLKIIPQVPQPLPKLAP
jgi:protein-tyrosine phosphatase